jgi:hypothetical protein
MESKDKHEEESKKESTTSSKKEENVPPGPTNEVEALDPKVVRKICLKRVKYS